MLSITQNNSSGTWAIVVSRESTESQDRGTSPETQIADCSARAATAGLEVPGNGIVRVHVSGTRYDIERPDIAQVLALRASDPRFTYVVYWDQTRLYRPGSPENDSHKIFYILDYYRDAGLQVLLANGSLGNVFETVGRSYGAGQERQDFRRRTEKAKRATARAGKYPIGYGQSDPYGLRLVDGRLFWLSESHRGYVQTIFDLFDHGYTIRGLFAELNRLNIPTAKGSPWERSSVGSILKNAKLYAGTNSYKDIDIPDNVDRPVLTQNQADAVYARLKVNKEKSYGFGKRKWLTGRVFCGSCGRRYALSGRSCRCNGRDAIEKCPNPTFSLKRIERETVGVLRYLELHPSVLAEAVNQSRQAEDQASEHKAERLASLDRRTVALAKERDKIVMLFRKGVYSETQLDAELALLDVQLKDIESERSLIDVEPVVALQFAPTVDVLLRDDGARKRWRDGGKNEWDEWVALDLQQSYLLDEESNDQEETYDALERKILELVGIGADKQRAVLVESLNLNVRVALDGSFSFDVNVPEDWFPPDSENPESPGLPVVHNRC